MFIVESMRKREEHKNWYPSWGKKTVGILGPKANYICRDSLSCSAPSAVPLRNTFFPFKKYFYLCGISIPPQYVFFFFFFYSMF